MSEAKRGRGRPRMNPGEARTSTFSVRLTPDERAAVAKAAERAGGIDASEWARRVIVAAAAVTPR